MTNRNYLITLSLGAFFIGILLFAFSHGWIIFNFPFGSKAIIESNNSTVHKQLCTIYYYKNGQTKSEKKELIWSNNTTNNLIHLTKTWLSLLDEEEVVFKKTTLQTLTLSPNSEHAIISFDRVPFNNDDSTQIKLMLIESFLQSIREAIPTLKAVQFLVHHQAISDYHLDFSRPWPLSGFVSAKNSTDQISKKLENTTITIMLDPAGDAQNTGRIIGDNFERGITLQYAQALKKELENRIPHVRIILTRFPGETLEPLQNAAFSNRLRADFYISINFYPAQKQLSQCFLYYFVYDPITDFWHKKQKKLSFSPYNSAHLNNLHLSDTTAQTIFKKLEPFQNQGLLSLNKPFGAPFKPLIGVQAIGIGCEIGLHNKDDWRIFVSPIAQAISETITELFQ